MDDEMTPQDKAKHQAEVMLAYANGAEIEWMHTRLNHWSPLPEVPIWNFNSFDYRVKPAPKVVKLEAWITSGSKILYHYKQGAVIINRELYERIPSLDLEYVEEA